MPRGKRNIPIDDGQLHLWDEPPPPVGELCWDCGRPLAEVQKRGVSHGCPPACTRCGIPYWWHGRVSKQYRCWRPSCGCDPYPKNYPPYSWWASLVPERPSMKTRRRRRPDSIPPINSGE
jgi:hypothetical protein